MLADMRRERKTLIAAAIGFCCGWGLTSIVQKLLA